MDAGVARKLFAKGRMMLTVRMTDLIHAERQKMFGVNSLQQDL